ncbi:MAG: hypothetical protein NTY07_10875 [Bacteroidia bacterium]|nr:hypothetical protein [Bacteroidia bacterium]
MDKLRIFQLKSIFDEIVHFINIDDHFREVTKMVELGKVASDKKKIEKATKKLPKKQ